MLIHYSNKKEQCVFSVELGEQSPMDQLAKSATLKLEKWKPSAMMSRLKLLLPSLLDALIWKIWMMNHSSYASKVVSAI
jgi:hypothetical protein